MAIVCLTLTACAGFDPDLEIPPDEVEDYTGGISVDGVKVLRRPIDGYNFDENVPENDGTTDFYYSLADDIIFHLFYTYGNFNTAPQINNIFLKFVEESDNEKVGELAQQFKENPDGFLYYYDTIRYQITFVAHDEASGNYRVTADDKAKKISN